MHMDHKLIWNKRIDKTEKTKSALGTCCRLAGSRWGIKKKYTMWLYTAVILACLIITGAISSTPTLATETLLNLPTLHIFVQKEARASMVRAIEMGRESWYSSVMRNLRDSVMNIPLMTMSSDAMMLTHNSVRFFKVTIPERAEWKEDTIPPIFRKAELVWFTDGSRREGSAGSGVFCQKPKALQSDNVCSKLTMETIALLNHLGTRNYVTLGWVPGHSNIGGNKPAHELAGKASGSRPVGPEPNLGNNKPAPRRVLNIWVSQRAQELWKRSAGLTRSKLLIRGFSQTYTSVILSMNWNNLRMITRSLLDDGFLREPGE
ncbi:hypothetical protein NE865_10250 [Phthorimaea operculella]|nr:hypothetical protein NE865_10250 [Phthorimaea operculella]